MVRKRIAVGGLTGAVFVLQSLLPAPAAADDMRETDLRCLAAFAARASDAKDETGKQQATIGVIYFFGRIDGEAPQTDLQAELARLGQTMTDADLKTVLGPCAKRLGERGQVLMNVGNKLQQQGK